MAGRIRLVAPEPLDRPQRHEPLRCACGVLIWGVDRPFCLGCSVYARAVAAEAERRGERGGKRAGRRER